MNLILREAVLDDVETIQLLNKKLFEYEIDNKFDDNLDANWSMSEEGKLEISDRIVSNTSCGFVAIIDDVLVGYIIGLIQEDETGRSDSRYTEMEHMFVDENYRNHGIGESLVTEFKNWTKSKGLKIIKANVSYKNKKAIEFYKKLGLIPIDLTMLISI